MGLKWVQKWVLMHFDPLLHPKIHFWTHFWTIDKKPTLNPLFVEINCSPKKGPEAALTQHNYRAISRIEGRQHLSLQVSNPLKLRTANSARNDHIAWCQKRLFHWIKAFKGSRVKTSCDVVISGLNYLGPKKIASRVLLIYNYSHGPFCWSCLWHCHTPSHAHFRSRKLTQSSSNSQARDFSSLRGRLLQQ